MSSDMYLDDPKFRCLFTCFTNTSEKFYDISLSSTGKNLSSNATDDFGFGSVFGEVISDSLNVAGFEVSHGEFY